MGCVGQKNSFCCPFLPLQLQDSHGTIRLRAVATHTDPHCHRRPDAARRDVWRNKRTPKVLNVSPEAKSKMAKYNHFRKTHYKITMFNRKIHYQSYFDWAIFKFANCFSITRLAKSHSKSHSTSIFLRFSSIKSHSTTIFLGFSYGFDITGNPMAIPWRHGLFRVGLPQPGPRQCRGGAQ